MMEKVAANIFSTGGLQNYAETVLVSKHFELDFKCDRKLFRGFE